MNGLILMLRGRKRPFYIAYSCTRTGERSPIAGGGDPLNEICFLALPRGIFELLLNFDVFGSRKLLDRLTFFSGKKVTKNLVALKTHLRILSRF
jgi:hypothetical protein